MSYCSKYIIPLLCLVTAGLCAQVKKGDTYPSLKVKVDSTYGITLYEKLNFSLGGDSIRYDKKGYSAAGWYEDYYENGKLLHKGYYADGNLRTYQNFYDNGQLERSFKTDYNKSSMKIYYRDGKTRAEIDYVNGNTVKETDYYPNGSVEFVEEYNKDGQFIRNNFYSPDGKPLSLLEIIDPKKLIYAKKEYHENGQIKEEGTMIYSKAAGDYQKDGKWIIYDESGKAVAEQNWAKGEMANEKKL
jgi:antitoxin component YwqK of YwqJK toxin-antitoxin module